MNKEIKEIKQLKAEIEKQTKYEFVIKKNILGEEVLYLQDLPKKTEITVCLRFWKETNKQYISLSGKDNRAEYRGFGCPCDSIDDVIKQLAHYANRYGYKVTDKQLGLLDFAEYEQLKKEYGVE